MLAAPLSRVDRSHPPNARRGGDPAPAIALPGRGRSLYLVYFWNPISRGADRGRMTSTESSVRVKCWSAYQGCGAGGAPGRRKSHTRGREGRRGSEPRGALLQLQSRGRGVPSSGSSGGFTVGTESSP